MGTESYTESMLEEPWKLARIPKIPNLTCLPFFCGGCWLEGYETINPGFCALVDMLNRLERFCKKFAAGENAAGVTAGQNYLGSEKVSVAASMQAKMPPPPFPIPMPNPMPVPPGFGFKQKSAKLKSVKSKNKKSFSAVGKKNKDAGVEDDVLIRQLEELTGKMTSEMASSKSRGHFQTHDSFSSFLEYEEHLKGAEAKMHEYAEAISTKRTRTHPYEEELYHKHKDDPWWKPRPEYVHELRRWVIEGDARDHHKRLGKMWHGYLPNKHDLEFTELRDMEQFWKSNPQHKNSKFKQEYDRHIAEYKEFKTMFHNSMILNLTDNDHGFSWLKNFFG